MADTNFTPGTVVSSDWLNDVNDTVYGLASTASGKGAALVGFDPAMNYTLGTLGWAEQRSLSLNMFATGIDTTGATDSLAGFKAMVALARALGVKRLRIGAGNYLLNLAAKADCIDCTDILLDCEPGVVFTYGYFDWPLFYWIGSNGGGIVGKPNIVFTGTRPGAAPHPGDANLGSFVGAGIISPPDLCCHVAILGTNNATVDIAWQGQTTSNRKEVGILLYGGTATGPDFGGGTYFDPGPNAVYSKGNRIKFHSDDVAFGITYAMQDDMDLFHVYSGRYWVDAFVGPGHVIYQTGCCKNSRFHGGTDASIPIHTPGTGTHVGGQSWQWRSPQNCTFGKFTSKRPEGSHGITNAIQDNTGGDFQWSADRYPYEAGLGNHPVCTIVNQNATSVIARNRWGKWKFVDQSNAGAGRSANCAIMGNGGATYVSNNTQDNSYDIEITFSPDGGYNKGVAWLHGNNNVVDLRVNNKGTGQYKAGILIMGDAAGSKASQNTVNFTCLGTNALGWNITGQNSNGDNVVRLIGSGNMQATGSGMGTTDRFIFDSATYTQLAPGAITPDCQKYSTIQISLSGTATTINAPANPVQGARLRFVLTQDGTGGRTVTWNAAFKKEADGAGAANAAGATEFVYNGSNWVQIGGALTFS